MQGLEPPAAITCGLQTCPPGFSRQVGGGSLVSAFGDVSAEHGVRGKVSESMTEGICADDVAGVVGRMSGRMRGRHAANSDNPDANAAQVSNRHVHSPYWRAAVST